MCRAASGRLGCRRGRRTGYNCQRANFYRNTSFAGIIVFRQFSPMLHPFDPDTHVLAVHVAFHKPVLRSGWTGTLQVAGQPTDTTHAQVLERNAGVFDFLSSERNDLHIRERIELNHGQLQFGYLPHPLPKNSRGQFRIMDERT